MYMYKFYLKMMPKLEREISVLFLHPFDALLRISCLKIDEFSYFFITSHPLNVTFSESPYLASHLKISYETGHFEVYSEKKILCGIS